ncbi:hypothetical protein FOA43_004033 [Brettanomyces nanus]|uniref:Cytochrome c oxidase assembly factor 3 n=1 Tax=Eeniella nana TaxID=13502 RepID=A0A875S4S8_EENNA|nr:uncharacterized protein FOA43_004033 [Brettanomyces nanus]QPG76641.1 hypothetical protein FOA43_004033 [Brettanomyces nanus]
MIPSFIRFSARSDSYYSKDTYRMSAAMLRARRPYFWRNMAGLVILGSIPVAVYVYTFNFLHTDDLEDIPVPPLSDEKVKQLQKEYKEEKAKEAAGVTVRK